MPIYEYECEKCAYRFELKRRFGEDGDSTYCPQCRGKVRQLFSPPIILYKGSGFYVTDSRSDRNRPSEDSKTDKIEGSKTDKVESGKKENSKTDKAESSKKEESK